MMLAVAVALVLSSAAGAATPADVHAMFDQAEREAFTAPILERYEREGSPYYATARLWDDGILDPPDTRRTLALALSACLNAPIERTQYGIFRM